MAHRILIVDDEADIREFIGYNLTREGYEVAEAENGEEAVRRTEEFRPHLVLMDMMMPVMNGREACEAIRSNPTTSNTMIIFLSAVHDEESLVRSYSSGADDYITKPVSMRVLCSRIKAIMKRIEPQGEERLVSERRTFMTDSGEVHLPVKEFEILQLLCSEPERIFSRQEIYDHVWGDEVIVGGRTLDVHIRRLRRKIGDRHISTHKGVGFKYEA